MHVSKGLISLSLEKINVVQKRFTLRIPSQGPTQSKLGQQEADRVCGGGYNPMSQLLLSLVPSSKSGVPLGTQT